MLLYHGTSAKRYKKIRKEGLHPRYSDGGNWFTNIRSNREMVYLSKYTSDSEHYGLRASVVDGSKEYVILFVDTDHLDQDNLRVDENFLDIEERGAYQNCNISDRQRQREQAIKDKRWEDSVSKMGYCGHVGPIDPSLIRVYLSKELRDNRFFRPEFFSHKDPVANCYVYDVFMRDFVWHTQDMCWVFKEDWSTKVPDNYFVDVEAEKSKWKNWNIKDD